MERLSIIMCNTWRCAIVNTNARNIAAKRKKKVFIINYLFMAGMTFVAAIVAVAGIFNENFWHLNVNLLAIYEYGIYTTTMPIPSIEMCVVCS